MFKPQNLVQSNRPLFAGSVFVSVCRIRHVFSTAELDVVDLVTRHDLYW